MGGQGTRQLAGDRSQEGTHTCKNRSPLLSICRANQPPLTCPPPATPHTHCPHFTDKETGSEGVATGLEVLVGTEATAVLAGVRPHSVQSPRF